MYSVTYYLFYGGLLFVVWEVYSFSAVLLKKTKIPF